jgi:hypothetical protein
VKVVLHIERLVVDAALAANERPARMRAALEQALMHDLREPGAARMLLHIGAVDALAPVSLPGSDGRNDSLGSRVGAAVGAGLGLHAGGRSFDETARKSCSIKTPSALAFDWRLPPKP